MKDNPSLTLLIAVIAALWAAFSANWQCVRSMNEYGNMIVTRKVNPSSVDIPKERQDRMLDDWQGNAVIFVISVAGFGVTIIVLPILLKKDDRHWLLWAICSFWGGFLILGAVASGVSAISEFGELYNVVNSP